MFHDPPAALESHSRVVRALLFPTSNRILSAERYSKSDMCSVAPTVRYGQDKSDLALLPDVLTWGKLCQPPVAPTGNRHPHNRRAAR